MTRTTKLAVVWSSCVAVLLVAPAFVVIPLSFSERRSFAFPPSGLSLKWYINIFTDHAWWSSILTSLGVGLTVAVVATVGGTLAAIAIRWSRGVLGTVAYGVLLSPLVMPGIIVAVALYGLFLRWQLNNSFSGFVIGHTVLAIPFVVVAVDTNLKSYDRTLNRAAAVLGSNPVSTFVRVTLPLILPGVASGAGFAFITSFDEVVLAVFLQGPHIRTLPVQMWSSVRQETDPTLSAVASLMVLLATVLILAPLVRKRKKAQR